jgi:hypothetical protein
MSALMNLICEQSRILDIRKVLELFAGEFFGEPEQLSDQHRN